MWLSLVTVAMYLCQCRLWKYLGVVNAALQRILAQERDADVLCCVHHLSHQPWETHTS